MRTRILALGAGAALALNVACSDSTGPGGVGHVALLANTNFVEYDTSLYDYESSELEHTLRYLGVGTTLVNAVDSTSLAAALANSGAFIIPEQEGSYQLDDSLSAGARALLVDWVDSTGGILIICPDGSGLAVLDSLFGYTIGGGNNQDNYARDDTAATSTAYAGGPDVVWDNDGTYTVDVGTLPAGAHAVYVDGTDAAIVVIARGRGAVVLLGWDWYNAFPHGAQDGGWVEALRRALRS